MSSAAAASGIPFDEVIEYAKTRMGCGEAEGWSLRLIAQKSLKTALETLEGIATDGPRPGRMIQSTDLDAAIALSRIAIEAQKLSLKYKPPPVPLKPDEGGGLTDLFDRAPNPWDLKDPGEID